MGQIEALKQKLEDFKKSPETDIKTKLVRAIEQKISLLENGKTVTK
jgi:hypothetical protein